ATGGGAFMNEETRALLKAKAVTAWLKADLDTLVRRVSRRRTRPLLVDKDPGEVLRGHMEQRYPVYAEADIVIDAGGGTHETAVQSILTALKQRSEAA
ncbi:MAG: shikimate kinase, partial [Caulobacteraceae bacterium]